MIKRKKGDESYASMKHRCPKNWSSSSISMELQGILECIKSVWNSGIAELDMMIVDSSILDQIALGLILRWPLDKHGKNIKCIGHLPKEIKAIRRFLVDPSHCHHVYGSHLYKLEQSLTAMKKTDKFTFAKSGSCKSSS